MGEGQIFVTFQVIPSERYEAIGSDIHTEEPVTIAQAVLGGSINVVGIYGERYPVQVSRY